MCKQMMASKTCPQAYLVYFFHSFVIIKLDKKVFSDLERRRKNREKKKSQINIGLGFAFIFLEDYKTISLQHCLTEVISGVFNKKVTLTDNQIHQNNIKKNTIQTVLGPHFL